jgi:hypothetical protein
MVPQSIVVDPYLVCLPLDCRNARQVENFFSERMSMSISPSTVATPYCRTTSTLTVTTLRT